jgi:hypothetical protein
MGIITTPVKTVRVSYGCDKCKVGELTYTGQSVSNTFSSKHTHVCNRCVHGKELDTIYPYIDYEEYIPGYGE